MGLRGQGRIPPRSDNRVRAVATSRKTIPETAPDTGEGHLAGAVLRNRRSEFRHTKHGGACVCVGGQRARSSRRSLRVLSLKSTDPTVDVGIFLVWSGFYQELCSTQMQHVLFFRRRMFSCSVYICSYWRFQRMKTLVAGSVLVSNNHMHGILGRLDRRLQNSRKSLQLGAPRALARIVCSVEQKGFCVVSDCVALCFKWGSATQLTEKVSVDESVTTILTQHESVDRESGRQCPTSRPPPQWSGCRTALDYSTFPVDPLECTCSQSVGGQILFTQSHWSLHTQLCKQKSWRPDAPIILLGWEHHSHGSQ